MASLSSHNPATLELLGRVPVAGAEDIRAAVERARSAQPAWRATALHERAALMRRAAEVVAARSDDLARDLTAESGKTLFEAYAAEVLPTAETFRWLARFGPRHLRPERLRHASPLFRLKRSWLHYEPMGVVGIISPWNYPLAIPATEIAFALMAGNAVVCKPSEHTPLVADEIRNILAEAGVPAGLVQIVHGAGDAGAALVEAAPDRLLFTGSVATGRRVAAAAGERGIPVTLELGGKDAMYVRADADVERAVSGALFGAYFNAGQTCAAVERLYVHKDVAGTFVDRLAARAKALRVGDPMSHTTDVGPMIHDQQRALVAEHVAEAEGAGARRLTGGPVDPGLGGAFFAPAVLVDVPDHVRLMREETFGPALPIRVVSSDEEAVRLANDTPYGLTASLWTRNVGRAQVLARELQAGTVFVNDVLYSYASPDAPWGGVKSSGTGRTHSRHGLYELTSIKHVSVDPGWLPAFGYPYSQSLTNTIRSAIKAIYGRGPERGAAVLRGAVSAARAVRASRRHR